MARTVLCNETEKNIIPVLLAGASFPKQLPDDINEVRNFQAPTCVHEYFDSFYSKLKDFLHAYPRSAPYSSPSTLSPNLPKLKLKADLDCVFYLDGKETARLISGELSLIPLSEGEYELKFVNEENAEDIVTEDYFEIPNRDKRYDVKLLPICEKRLGYRTVDDGLVFNAKGVEFKMVHVEGDIFMMGAQKTNPKAENYDEEALENESPVHSVTLSSFYIGETVVTQALWKAIMGSNPSYIQGDILPVENVIWNDCQEFIHKLNQVTGKSFRLPTEAEWEYAARGGKRSKGYKYAGSNVIGDVAWHHGNSENKTHAVKTKLSNELGIFDMSGNVWEWCQDWMDSYNSEPQVDPSGPINGFYRVLRGGSWCYGAWICRVSFRLWLKPNPWDAIAGFRKPSLGDAIVGLRLVLPQ